MSPVVFSTICDFFICTMKKILLFLVLLIAGSVQAQSMQEVGKKMEQLPKAQEQSISTIATYISNQFSSDDDKIAAVFYWTAHTI